MKEKNQIQRQTTLTGNLLGFCRHLRTKGFALGPQEEVDTLQALSILPTAFNSPENFQLVLRSLLARSLQQQKVFDMVYTDYWDELEKAVNAKEKEEAEEKQQPKPEKSKSKQDGLQALKSWLYGNKEEEELETATYSATEVWSEKDFSAFTDLELEEVINLIHLIAKSLATRYKRLYEKSQSVKFDLRRTLRQNMRRGGEIVDLFYQKPKKEKIKLVLLCDVSKSMDLYSRFLIQFMYAFQKTYRAIETFVFSTSLHRVTQKLRQDDFDKTLEDLGKEVKDWAGGTRIGESLQTFVNDYSLRQLDHNTIVLIISDGWDTGDTELLADSMKAIQQKAAKVIWLNPLAGNSAFAPTVKGMEVAMPYIDVFAPAHNLQSLRDIITHLKK